MKGVSLGAAKGETKIAAACMILAILSPNMIRLYGDFKPFLDRINIVAIVADARNDRDAVTDLTDIIHINKNCISTCSIIYG